MKSKLKLTVLFLSFSFTIVKVKAQNNPVKISHQVNTNKSVDFDYQKTDPGSYTVLLKFTNLTNSSQALEQEFSVKNYTGIMLTLSPEKKEEGIGFSYTYSSIRGKLNPKYNADFIYLLPVKSGKKVRVAEASFLSAKYFGNTTPEDWKVYHFYTPVEDTITAARKGIVVDIKDLYETDAAQDVSYTSKINELTIEHADGTLAIYKGFKKGSIAVKTGQTVFPAAALGINSKYNSNSKFASSLSIIYLKSTDISTRKQGLQNSKSLYGFVTPRFCTAEQPNVILTAQQEYTAADTPELIRKEFTKKELKMVMK